MRLSSAARIWMRPAFCPVPKKSKISWPTIRRQALQADRSVCSSATSSWITGRTNGPTCCWFPAASCARIPCGRSTTGSATASRTTSPGISSPMKSSPSSGDTRQNGALNYYVLHKDAIDLTETATRSVHGQPHHLCALPQSSAGEVDAEAVLPDGEPVLACGLEERIGTR